MKEREQDSAVGLLAEEIQDLKENGPKQLYGVYTGVVKEFPDVPPLGSFQGRVKVLVQAIDPLFPLDAWARVAVPMAGPGYGAYFIPMLESEVLVAFENGDIRKPYVIGALWNAVDFPPLPMPETQIRTLRSPVGNQVVFTEVPPSVVIQSGPTPPVTIPAPFTPASPPPTLMLSPLGITMSSPTGITLVSGTSVVMIGPEKIMMTSGQNGITISPAGITILGHPSVQINPFG